MGFRVARAHKDRIFSSELKVVVGSLVECFTKASFRELNVQVSPFDPGPSAPLQAGVSVVHGLGESQRALLTECNPQGFMRRCFFAIYAV